MQTQPQLSWWVTGVMVPAFFTLLGAVVGFLVGELKDKLQARRSKQAFLKAIAIEAASLKTSLEQGAQQAEIFVKKLQESGHAPQLIPRWGTMVFDTQLGKLGDIADDLLLQIIETYARVGQVDRIVAMVNQFSQDYVSARPGNEKAEAQSRLGSALLVFREETGSTVSNFQALIQKLSSRR